jgi:hypothetical protein
MLVRNNTTHALAPEYDEDNGCVNIISLNKNNSLTMQIIVKHFLDTSNYDDWILHGTNDLLVKVTRKFPNNNKIVTTNNIRYSKK